MIRRRRAAIGLLALFSGIDADPASAGDEPPIAVGTFDAEQQCTTYVLTSGSERIRSNAASASVATRHGAAYAASSSVAYERSWRSELARDCTSDFEELRGSIAAALLATGAFRVVPQGTARAMVIGGRLSGVNGFSEGASGVGYVTRRDYAAASADWALRSISGETIQGGTLMKRVVVLQGVAVEGVAAASATFGRQTYTDLQGEIARAIARAAAFAVRPLRVVGIEDGSVRLSYGTAVVPVGSTILVTPRQGIPIRLNVISATEDAAWARSEAGRGLADVVPGSIANFVEPEDPAASGRRFDRVDLPG